MTEEMWYIGYADDLSASIDGPYKSFDEAVEAAKELFVDDSHEEDDAEILVFKVDATLKMTKSVDVQVKRIG